jgi:lysozyme
MSSKTILPPARPQQTREETARIIAESGLQGNVFLLGRRGYYLRSMGDPAKNDRGIYDDAIILYATGTAHVTFNANTDPSAHRPGIASLIPGAWSYKLGIHGLSKPKAQQYTALVQAAPVTVARDSATRGGKPVLDTGYFGINIHRGGRTGTSSLGCQTIHPDQWPAFIALVQQELKRHGQKTIPYLLTENV